MSKSWVESAESADTDFPIQNLPFGVFRTAGAARCGVAIGDRILDVAAAARDGLFEGASKDAALACAAPELNGLMALGKPAWKALRARLSALLDVEAPRAEREKAAKHLHDRLRAELLLPARVGDYTDFYASIQHATRVGRLFRPDNPLLPNYKHVPIGYHGRSSSLVPSGTAVRRPSGQRKAGDFGPTEKLDYELELGFFVGPGNALGTSIPIAEAQDRIFGVCLVNDWSARDIQAWEYQPLGPFLGKSFATSVSPWVVPLEALDPFRVAPAPRDPALPYLSLAGDVAFDLTLEAWLGTSRLSVGRTKELYWTPAQLVAHHASNGCNLRPGDLIASGTVSGEGDEARGCLLEITANGAQPVKLPDGTSRRWLEDGDEVVLRGYAERPGARRIGLGECRGRILKGA
ncbi:MAG TPA: fumarylacetoacetase [Planctomycetota bacterium]